MVYRPKSSWCGRTVASRVWELGNWHIYQIRKEKKLSRQVYLDIVRTPYASQTCTSFNSMLTIDNYSNILQNNRIKQKTNNLLDKRKLFIEHFS